MRATEEVRVCATRTQCCAFGPVQTKHFEAKNKGAQTKHFESKSKSEDEIGERTPSGWPQSLKGAQEADWARFSFSLLPFSINQKLKTKRPSRPERESRPWRQPQLRTPRALDSQRTESRQCTISMSLMPAIAASVTAAQPVAHQAVPHRIECCRTLKNRLQYCSINSSK